MNNEGVEVPYEHITEKEATDRGLPGHSDTSYRKDTDGTDRGYNKYYCVYWDLGESKLGA